MKINKIIWLFLSLGNISFLGAREIKGYIYGQPGHRPVSFANVLLMTQKDSSFIRGVVSDSCGYYSLGNVDSNKYILKVSSIGYNTKYISPEEMRDTLFLSENSIALQQAVVIAHRPVLQMKNGSLITNVEGSALAKSGSVANLLERIPGLVKMSGSLLVLGKGAPEIYINKRKLQDESELNQLNSEDVKSVEVIANPDARYSASAGSVVIIHTRNRQKGSFFNLDTSQQLSHYYSSTYQANYTFNTGKWFFFGTFQTAQNETRAEIDNEKTTYVNHIWNLDNKLYQHWRDHNYQAKAGFGYDSGNGNSAGFYYQYVNNRQNMNFSGIGNLEKDGSLVQQTHNEGSTRLTSYPGHSMNFYYIGKILGMSIDLNADYVFTKQDNSTAQTEKDYYSQEETTPPTRINTKGNNRSNLFAGKLLFTTKFWKGTFSFGAEYTNTNRQNSFFNNEGILRNSNDKIVENNIAPFCELLQQFGKINLTAGLRYEHVDSRYWKNGNHSDGLSRRYDNVFPSVQISVPVGKAQVALSYINRIIRPTYEQLDGNVYYQSQFSYYGGNPALQSSVRHDVTAQLQYKWLNFRLSYTQDRNPSLYISKVYSSGHPEIAFVTFENYPKLNNLTAFTVISPLIGCWNPTLAAGVTKQWLNARFREGLKSFNRPIPILQLQNRFALPWHLNFQLDGSYQGKGYYQNIEENNQWQVDVSLQKTFCKDRLNILLESKDVFNLYI